MAASWPPKEGLDTPTISARDAHFTLKSSAEIAASASLVFGLVQDVSTYPEWNTFIQKVDVSSQSEGVDKTASILQVGTKFTAHANMEPGKTAYPMPLLVTDVSTPEHQSTYIPQAVLEESPSYTSDLTKVYRISWRDDSGLVGMALHTHRVHEIIVIDDTHCEMRTWESMTLPLARVVKWMHKARLDARYEQYALDLKAVAEKRANLKS